MSYTSTSDVERIRDMLHRRIERDLVRLGHDRCPEVVEVWRAHRRRAELFGRLARHTATAAFRGRRTLIASRSAATTIRSSPGCIDGALIPILVGVALR